MARKSLTGILLWRLVLVDGNERKMLKSASGPSAEANLSRQKYSIMRKLTDAGKLKVDADHYLHVESFTEFVVI